MIPAILSCAFVAYLYVSLNAPISDDVSDVSSEANSPSERLKAIETRLQRLIEKTQK